MPKKKDPEQKFYYTIHANPDYNKTMETLKREVKETLLKADHPTSVSFIRDIVRLDLRLFRDIIEEELVKFLVVEDEKRRVLSNEKNC